VQRHAALPLAHALEDGRVEVSLQLAQHRLEAPERRGKGMQQRAHCLGPEAVGRWEVRRRLEHMLQHDFRVHGDR
tara:strand:- start:461 stop:685 length:225 start_codon:yes stop_codon:yes gene_type:complete